MSALRVTHVITGLGVGGAETMLYKLLGALDPAHFPAQVISLGDEGVLGAKIRALGVPVTALGMRPGAADPRAITRLAGLLRAGCDVLQTWMYHADLLGGLAAWLVSGGLPLAWNVRNTDLAPQRTRAGTLRVARACALLSGVLPRVIVTNSQAARDVHVRFGYAAAKFLVIPNGFDLARFQPDPAARFDLRAELRLPQDAPLVGLAARFDPVKDHHGFLQAAGRVAERFPAAHFVLCGEGVTPQNAELIAWARAAGVPDCVHLLGRRDDMPRIMAALDVYASSSLSEAFPNVIGEAMACGVPCAVTRAGDSAEIVGDTGRVVPPGDPAALAEACCALLSLSPAARAALGQQARQRVRDRFDLAQVSAQYAALYQRLAGRG